MMKLCLALILALLPLGHLAAGHLDIAVIQFPEARDPAALAAAFSEVDLAKLTDGDTTRTRNAALKNGKVIFSQGFPASRGGAFRSATRIGAYRSDVNGSLGTSGIDFRVSVTEGIQSGIRSFEKKSYNASGSLPSGPATIVSLRQGEGKAPYVVRGKSTVEKFSFTIVVAAQYRP